MNLGKNSWPEHVHLDCEELGVRQDFGGCERECNCKQRVMSGRGTPPKLNRYYTLSHANVLWMQPHRETCWNSCRYLMKGKMMAKTRRRKTEKGKWETFASTTSSEDTQAA